MGENATEGFFIGTYIFVFIVALSATIIMFNTINEYSERAYEYGKNVENAGTLIETNTTTTARLVTADQIISYYFNYIDDNTEKNYEIRVYKSVDESGPINEILKTKGLSYTKVMAELGADGLTQTYRLRFDGDKNGKTNITIYPYLANVIEEEQDIL